MVSPKSRTKRPDKNLLVADKKPVKRYRKRRPGETRGRPMSEKSKSEIERVQALWNSIPEATQLRLAFLTGASLSNVAKWCERGHLKAPPQIEKQREERKVILERKAVAADCRPDTPIDDEWDGGPVPTIESIRREIKRRIQGLILDADSVSKYATALAKLDGIRDKEREQANEEEEERMILSLPMENKVP